MITKLLAVSLIGITLNGTAFAQESSKIKEKKEERIIITKKGTGDQKMTVVVDGDKVTVNGKPVDQLNDKDVQVLKEFDNDGNFSVELPEGLHGMMAPPHMNMFKVSDNKAFLGVMTEKDEKGAKITDVTKESAAEKAGLKKGDIIIKVNDTKIEDGNSLYDAIGKFKPENKVKITYLRDGKENTVTASLGKNKSQNFVFNNRDFNFKMPPDGNFRNFNFDFRPSKPRLGLKIQDMENGSGVKVIDVDDESPAEKAGLKEDDIITEINGGEVKNVDDLRSKIKDLKEGDTYKIKYKRDGKTQSVEVKIPKKLKTADL
ncbi:putative periplasmic serine endoprotease DegP-like precursor [mine drainage metagenome]|uniref:Putative periplasmic serine endoprotease DegP-like n=1 Tax=mine drainage metagenome TaxID=410659 RepID=A0A1J5TJ36_9ZZZZ